MNGETLSRFELFSQGWLHLNLDLSPELSAASTKEYELEIRADRTWQPRPADDESRDDREISIAVCNIELSTRNHN